MSSESRDGLVYSHNFRRYFEDDNQTTIDMLEQVLQFGILSPRKAKELGVPFKRDTNIFVTGVKNYDNIIFLFPENQPSHIPVWHDAVTILLSTDMRVVTVEEMIRHQEGNWVVLSHLFGEVYRFGRISQRFFREIVLPSSPTSTLMQAKEMVKLYVPSMAEQIQVRTA